MRRRALLTTTAAFLAAAAGCATGDGTDETTERPTVTVTSPSPGPTTRSPTTTPSPTPDPALTITDHELVRVNRGSADELVKVTGTVTNDGDGTAEDVSVTVIYYDDQKSVLGESRVEIDELRSGATWSFETTFSRTGADARAVTDYRLVADTERG